MSRNSPFCVLLLSLLLILLLLSAPATITALNTMFPATEEEMDQEALPPLLTGPPSEATSSLHRMFVNEVDPSIREDRPVMYQGGNIRNSNAISVTGYCRYTGIMIWIDGRPVPFKLTQPYPLESDEDYRYMHKLNLDDRYKEDDPIIFFYETLPISGKKGEIKSLDVMYILNPDYRPSQEWLGLGNFQHIASTPNSIVMLSDVDSDAQDDIDGVEQPLSNVFSKTEVEVHDFTSDDWNYMKTKEEGEIQDFYEIYHGGKLFQGEARLSVAEIIEDPLIKVKAYIPPGEEVVLTPLLNQRAIVCDVESGDTALEMRGEFGKTITFIFYVNADALPDDVSIFPITSATFDPDTISLKHLKQINPRNIIAITFHHGELDAVDD